MLLAHIYFFPHLVFPRIWVQNVLGELVGTPAYML